MQTMLIKPTEEEIYKVLDVCLDAMEGGTSIDHSMSYEEGVAAGIRWMLGDAQHPIEEGP